MSVAAPVPLDSTGFGIIGSWIATIASSGSRRNHRSRRRYRCGRTARYHPWVIIFHDGCTAETLSEDSGYRRQHDFGRDILPRPLHHERKTSGLRFQVNDIPGLNRRARLLARCGKRFQPTGKPIFGTPPTMISGTGNGSAPASLINCYVDHALIGEGSRILSKQTSGAVSIPDAMSKSNRARKSEDLRILDQPVHRRQGTVASRRDRPQQCHSRPAPVIGHGKAGAAYRRHLIRPLTVLPKAVPQQDVSSSASPPHDRGQRA